jgi:hypothetical protein
MTAVNTPATLDDETFNTGRGIGARAAPRLIRAVRLQANQLNSPNKRRIPHIDASVATISVNSFASCPAIKWLTPGHTRATPAVARSKSSPQPGRPSGKTRKVDRSGSFLKITG